MLRNVTTVLDLNCVGVVGFRITGERLRWKGTGVPAPHFPPLVNVTFGPFIQCKELIFHKPWRTWYSPKPRIVLSVP